MATAQTPAVKTPKAKRAPVALATRIIGQLNQAALRGKLTAAEIENLETHLTKLKAFAA